MKKLLLALPVALIVLTACPGKKDSISNNPPNSNVHVVSQFVYDGMSTYYLWADEMVNKKPTSASTDPEAYFESVLNPLDKQKGWSWITDDVAALLADFSGTPVDFGWGLSLLWADQAQTKLVAFVKYVYPNTPAANAGFIRGNVITKINGADITTSQTATGYYMKLFGSAGITVTVQDQNYQNAVTKNLTPVQIQTNPVLKDSIYETNGKKIGYLFYTSFIGEFNNKLYEAFTKFKNAGVTDLVLDLRYNHGGSIDAAAFLASMIAPQSVVQDKSVFTILSYNNTLNQYFDQKKWSRKDSLGFPSMGLNPLGANLNLSKVYILATGDSYSAAELITFCLKPYMNVVHIGSNTGGKFTGSWTIHAYDDHDSKAVTIYDEAKLSASQKSALVNWAMQPIVAKYTDKNGADFVNPGYLVPNEVVDVKSYETDTRTWKQIGDRTDYLLAKAISLITGVPVTGVYNTTLPRSVYGFNDAKLFAPIDGQLKESVQLKPPKSGGVSGHELLMLLQRERIK